MPPANTVIKHRLKDVYDLDYKINNNGYRGPEITFEKNLKNIIVLGDSYAFGAGVQDGEEFPAILNGELEDFQVINFGVGGWGLTQQIKRFLLEADQFKPQIVLIQFSENDVDDNVLKPVIKIENDQLIPVDLDYRSRFRQACPEWLFALISKTQIYSFYRRHAYRVLRKKRMESSSQKHTSERKDRTSASQPSGPSDKELLYLNLLKAFSSHLQNKQIPLVYFGINNSLETFPWLKNQIQALHDNHILHFVDTTPWFKDVSNYSTPEGHRWGKKGHKIAAMGLKQRIIELQDGTSN